MVFLLLAIATALIGFGYYQPNVQALAKIQTNEQSQNSNSLTNRV